MIMNLTLFITDDCSVCNRVKRNLKNYSINNTEINLVIKDIKLSPYYLAIVPALYVEDILYSYGDVDLTKLNNFIESIDH